jgi:predicted permease
LEFFLISDWICARNVDQLSPDRPSPTGFRFYLDLAIPASFFASFWAARDSSPLLATFVAFTLVLSAVWSALLARAKRVPKPVRTSCNAYIVSHSIGALGFVLLWGHLAATKASPEWILGLWIVVYILWEAVDRFILWAVTKAAH